MNFSVSAPIRALIRRSWARDEFPAFPKWMPLGFMTSEYNLTAHAYYPGALDRAVMSGGYELVPHLYVPTAKPPGNARTGSVTLAAFDSQDFLFTPQTDTSMILLTACQKPASGPTPVTGATIDIFTGLAPDGSVQHKWNRGPVNIENITGSRGEPWIFKPPIFVRANEPVLVRLTNALSVANEIQVVFTGLGRITR